MIKKLVIIGITLSILIFIATKMLSFFKKVETNTVDPQASLNIENSKKNGLFLKQYEAESSQNNFFHVTEAWVEYAWKNTVVDSKIIKGKMGGTQLNFKLEGFREDSIKNDRYLLDWAMHDIVNGSVRKSSVYSVFVKDTELPDSFNIVLSRVKNNIIGEKLGQFTIKKK